MSFSQLEASIMAHYAEVTNDVAAPPSWTEYPHVRSAGLVHRLVILPGFVHDELTLEPGTACGIPLDLVAHKAQEDPERAGFCRATEALTCMTCASGRASDGDVRRRQANKQLLYGATYGLKNMASVLGRFSGKSNVARALQSMQYTQAMVRGYAAHDAANVLVSRKRRYSAAFMHQLAGLVLPP